jgi:hypothetical protein
MNGVFYAVHIGDVIRRSVGERFATPRGAGIEYLHLSLASRRR